jgi:hypothetical protein
MAPSTGAGTTAPTVSHTTTSQTSPCSWPGPARRLAAAVELARHEIPVLLVERRTILDAHARPVEATESRYAGDRYALFVSFEVEAPGRSRAPSADVERRP